MRFVAGELLELEIKPLDLGYPDNEQYLKKDCTVPCGSCKSNETCNCDNICCLEEDNNL